MFFKDYFYFGCSAMSKSVESGILRGRPFGSVLMMIHNNLRKITKLFSVPNVMPL